jgi:hypothetical protein
LPRLLDHYFYKVIQELVHHRYEEEILPPPLDANLVDAQQNLGELNLDVPLPFQGVVPRLDVEVDAELRLQLKMDCCLDAVDVERQ